MTTATTERIATERESLMHVIKQLPDGAILQIKGYIDRVREEEELRVIEAEITALEAKYGTTPNAETIAAIEELRAGKGERVTIEQIMAELNA